LQHRPDAGISLADLERRAMRIKGGGKVMVEAPRRQQHRRVSRQYDWYRDQFEAAPRVLPTKRVGVTMVGVLRDLVDQGKSRLLEDLRERDRAQLREVGRVLGGLSTDVVVELINHFAQRAPPLRAAPMVVLGALVGALFIEFWAATGGGDALDRALACDAARFQRELGVGAEAALERFVTFLEDTEGQPARRLVGTLYELG
jgi:hypothetical protein